MDLTGIGAVADAAKSILGMIFPDKTEAEKAQLAAALALVQAQTDVNKVEAQSSDRLQHWRGGLGWVCAAGYAYKFIVFPIGVAWIAHLHDIDISELSVLTAGMLGLGTLHVAERVKGVS